MGDPPLPEEVPGHPAQIAGHIEAAADEEGLPGAEGVIGLGEGLPLAQAIGGRDSEGAFGALDEAERETLKALLEKLLSDWEGV